MKRYIALYNTYDKNKFREGHRRAVVRASTLAYSFDFDIVLFDFPEVDSINELVSLCTVRTTVGERGKYLKELAAKNRIHMHQAIKKGFPPQYKPVVATTSHPDTRKKITTGKLAEMYNENRRFTILFGLGHRGLSRKILEASDYHYEVTGRNFDLETCVAMGCVVGKICGFAERL